MCEPYLERNPGDLISAADWNEMQCLIRDDIGLQAKEAVEGIEEVPRAADADKLEGSSKAEIIDEVIKKAVQEIRAKSGYMQLFKVLRLGKEDIVKHDLHLCPLVDLYQLDYFPVVCCEDKQTSAMWTTFYLYHSSEKKLRWAKNEGDRPTVFEIQPPDAQPFRIAFKDLLDRYKVSYTDDSSLGDLETEFWEAFFKAPNDEFDDDQHCHSPWFDRCCREQKSVRDLKRQGDWDELWFQMRARKTVNFPLPPPSKDEPLETTPAPTQIQVTQYDFDTIGLTLLAPPALPEAWFTQGPQGERVGRTEPPGSIEEQLPDIRDEIKLMVLLKV
jgi:hypothetical protein